MNIEEGKISELNDIAISIVLNILVSVILKLVSDNSYLDNLSVCFYCFFFLLLFRYLGLSPSYG